MRPNTAHTLHDFYEALYGALGPSRWWPGETPLEVIVGAVLTQNTAWNNVEKAISALKAAEVLEGRALLELPEAALAELIRPAGFFRLKAGRLRNVLKFFDEICDFDFGRLADMDTERLRERLLQVRGVGQETADSILLYALERLSFVVDAYTWRLLNRHGLAGDEAEYGEIREMFMAALPEDVPLYNEYHALIVRAGKAWCRKNRPLCAECPLGKFLE